MLSVRARIARCPIRTRGPVLRCLSCTVPSRLPGYLESKAITYTISGSPSSVLKCTSVPSIISPPPPGTLNIRYLLSPINPADLNVIEGVYPSKPSPIDPSGFKEPIFVAGNEGLGSVLEVGDNVAGIRKGDWVIMVKPQIGTWIAGRNVKAEDVLRVPKELVEGQGSLSDVQAATMSVNPPTAYGMLTGFVTLKRGEYIMQNGANSAVGQAVIQLASYLGLKTINFIRSRPEPAMKQLRDYLLSLGATHVYTYDDLSDKSLDLKGKVREWAGKTGIRLGLNCVGGRETTMMAKLLGQNAHLVSYGAMSKQPLSLPTSLFIFKNLTAHGYWQTRWYAERSTEDREEMVKTLIGLMANGKLKAPEVEIISLEGSDEEIGAKVREAVKKLEGGGLGKKVLLKFEGGVEELKSSPSM